METKCKLSKRKRICRTGEEEMNWFFKLNQPPTPKLQIIWDASKDVFRGLAVRCMARKRRKQKAIYQEVIQDLGQKEKEAQKTHLMRKLSRRL